QIQLVKAAVDKDAARVEHGAHGAVGHHHTAGETFAKLLRATEGSCIHGGNGTAVPVDFSNSFRLPAFQAKIAVLHLHRRSHMYLNPDESFRRPARRVVIDYDTHRVSIDEVHQNVAANDEVNRIPVVGNE